MDAGKFVIERDNKGTVTREPCDRCYVTGPHFGGDIYSGTADIAEATRYDIETARKLAATKWRDARPLVIEVED